MRSSHSFQSTICLSTHTHTTIRSINSTTFTISNASLFEIARIRRIFGRSKEMKRQKKRLPIKSAHIFNSRAQQLIGTVSIAISLVEQAVEFPVNLPMILCVYIRSFSGPLKRKCKLHGYGKNCLHMKCRRVYITYIESDLSKTLL